MKVYEDVLDFHEKFNFPIANRPQIPLDPLRDFRIHLIEEEIKETTNAILNDDLPEIADGIVDSIYVLVGTAITYGIDLRPIWDAVHEANMLKQKGVGNKAIKPEGWVRPDVEKILRAQLDSSEAPC